MKEHKKRFRIDFTVNAEGWSDDFIKESAIQELTCMVPYPEDISFSEVDNPWHTGTPTEEGWYLLATKNKNYVSYKATEIKSEAHLALVKEIIKPYKIVAWMPVPPFEASKERE